MVPGAHASPRPDPDGAGFYTIQVYGEVMSHWEQELRMRLSYGYGEQGPITTLTGHLPDQSALLGALGQLAMWGYQILLVRYESI